MLSAKVHLTEFTACTAHFGKLRPDSVMDCSQSLSGKTRWSNLKCFKCPDTSDFGPTISTMGSSKQLSRRLKLKIVTNSYKVGEGYKKIAKHFLMPISCVHNVIKKWQSSGTVEVKARSGTPWKISDRTAGRIVWKASQYPQLTARSLQKDWADTAVVVHHSIVKRYLTRIMVFLEESSEENLFRRPHHKKINIYQAWSILETSSVDWWG